MLEFEPDILQTKHVKPESRYYTAGDYHEMYRTGRVTPLQVALTLLDVTNKGGASSAKYADAWVDSKNRKSLVIEAAKASTERYASGKYLGVLDGVPVGIKDDTDVKGYVSNMGMKYNPSLPFFKEKEESSWPVKKLQEAGAVIIGKNCMHELGSGTVHSHPRYILSLLTDIIDTSGCNVRIFGITS
jgi:Asp-tRNA(Asn)/Glu-tRNA(Gln) amidotransferase A subunit family amidase